MTIQNSNWKVPADWQWHFTILIVFPCTTLLSSILLSVISHLQAVDVRGIYCGGIGAGIVGVLLLFGAKMPLHRQYRFWTFGPRQLDRKYRWVYWAGYICITTSFILLGCVCLLST